MRALERENPDEVDIGDTPPQASTNGQRRPRAAVLCGLVNQILPVQSLPFYFKHPAFLASFALSLLYFTVLSFSGQMITYLVSVGYTSLHVGIARVGSSIFEISATWAAPFLMKKIGVVRAGSWSLAWQMACLAGALGWYFSDHGGMGTNSIFSASGLAVGVALSRVGLWGFDLCAQNIIQDVSRLSQDHAKFFWAAADHPDRPHRKWRTNTGARSQPSRHPFRTCLRCSRMCRPLSFPVQTNSSILSSFQWRLFTRRADYMPTS